MSDAHDIWWRTKCGYPTIPVTGDSSAPANVPVTVDEIEATAEEWQEMKDFIEDCGGQMPLTPREFLDLLRRGVIVSPHRKAREASKNYDRAMKGI